MRAASCLLLPFAFVRATHVDQDAPPSRYSPYSDASCTAHKTAQVNLPMQIESVSGTTVCLNFQDPRSTQPALWGRQVFRCDGTQVTGYTQTFGCTDSTCTTCNDPTSVVTLPNGLEGNGACVSATMVNGFGVDQGWESLMLEGVDESYFAVCGGGGGDSDDDGDNPCFPSSATVVKADGTTCRVDALETGDEIAALTKEGVPTTDVVSSLSINRLHEAATFISLTTSTHRSTQTQATNTTLVLTGKHHLPVGTACCATLKKAKDLDVGDTLWAMVDGAPVASKLTKKETVKGSGLHSPILTSGHFPVVDGHVTSFDSIAKVTLAAYGLRYLEAACRLTDTCDIFRRIMF